MYVCVNVCVFYGDVDFETKMEGKNGTNRSRYVSLPRIESLNIILSMISRLCVCVLKY